VYSAILNYTSILKGSPVDLPPIRPVTFADYARFKNHNLHFRASAAIIPEPNALEFLVHFVGDIHQPLHVSWADDEGGNKVNVTRFGTKTNLHSVWDNSILQHNNSDYMSLSKELQNIVLNNSSLIHYYQQVTDPAVWANESFNLTRFQVYDFGSDGAALSAWYYENNIAVVKERLVAGGLRLAGLINSIF